MKVDEEGYNFLRETLSKLDVSCDPHRVENYLVPNLVRSRLAFETLYQAILKLMDETTKEYPQE